MARRSIAASLIVLAVLLASCGDDAGDPAPSPAAVAVDAAAAEGAIAALCELAGVDDLEEANAIFHDRAHETLHEIADAADDVDRPAAGDLLATKQAVEADLAAAELPGTFSADVALLIDATGTALEALGLDAAACPA